MGPFGMWIKCYASHVLVCGEYIDESRESRMICRRSSRDELVDASVSRQDMIDIGRTHAKAGALVFHEDWDSSVMTRVCSIAAALQRLGDASRLLVTSRGCALNLFVVCCSHSVSTTKVFATSTLCSLHTPPDCNNMEVLAARLVREWL